MEHWKYIVIVLLYKICTIFKRPLKRKYQRSICLENISDMQLV